MAKSNEHLTIVGTDVKGRFMNCVTKVVKDCSKTALRQIIYRVGLLHYNQCADQTQLNKLLAALGVDITNGREVSPWPKPLSMVNREQKDRDQTLSEIAQSVINADAKAGRYNRMSTAIKKAFESLGKLGIHGQEAVKKEHEIVQSFKQQFDAYQSELYMNGKAVLDIAFENLITELSLFVLNELPTLSMDRNGIQKKFASIWDAQQPAIEAAIKQRLTPPDRLQLEGSVNLVMPDLAPLLVQLMEDIQEVHKEATKQLK